MSALDNLKNIDSSNHYKIKGDYPLINIFVDNPITMPWEEAVHKYFGMKVVKKKCTVPGNMITIVATPIEATNAANEQAWELSRELRDSTGEPYGVAVFMMECDI